jgi:hypothetical protein
VGYYAHGDPTGMKLDRMLLQHCYFTLLANMGGGGELCVQSAEYPKCLLRGTVSRELTGEVVSISTKVWAGLILINQLDGILICRI